MSLFETVILILVFSFFFNGDASATDWKKSSQLSLQTIYNDNISLTTAPHDSVSGTITDILLGVTGTTETTQFSVTPKASIERYDNASELDDNVRSIPISIKANNEKSEIDISMNYSRDNTLTSGPLDTGYVSIYKHRAQWNIDPSLTYMLNERNTARLGFGYTRVSYVDAQETPLVDYSQPSVNIGDNYSISESAVFTASLYGSRFKAPRANNNITDNYGLNLAFSNRYSELLAYGVNISRYKTITNLEYPPGIYPTIPPYIFPAGFKSIDKKMGRLLGGNISWQGYHYQWKLELDNTIDPSSAGILVERNSLTLNMSHRINRFLTSSLYASESTNKANNNSNYFSDWRSRAGAATLSWRLRKELLLTGRYDYSWREFYSSKSVAESNRVMFSLIYRTQ